LTVAVPSSYIPGGIAYFRVRVSDSPLAFGSYVGTRVNGEVEDYFGASPTAVELVSFSAKWVRGRVLVAWETASELDTVGFNVWRGERSRGPSERVNAVLVPAKSLGGITGGRYLVTDPLTGPSTGTYYWLEEVERTGKTNLYGPVRVERAAPGYSLPLPVRLAP